jgi:pseudouridine synthase
MAKAGIASRRHSEELILRGKVKVDGKTIRQLGVKVDPSRNIIEVMGRKIDPFSPRHYLVLNKPKGYLTSVHDPLSRPVVTSLISDYRGLFPIGRLDKDTEGLLLLSNDGELAYRLTHPKYKVTKVYLALVQGEPSTKGVWQLRRGLTLEDGLTQPARVRIIKRYRHSCLVEIGITEGRKRQVRRMFRAIGNPVLELRRTQIGPVSLNNLPVGAYRPLKKEELVLLKELVGLQAKIS